MTNADPRETCGHVVYERVLPAGDEEVTCERPVWKYEQCIWHEDLGDRPEDESPWTS